MPSISNYKMCLSYASRPGKLQCAKAGEQERAQETIIKRRWMDNSAGMEKILKSRSCHSLRIKESPLPRSHALLLWEDSHVLCPPLKFQNLVNSTCTVVGEADKPQYCSIPCLLVSLKNSGFPFYGTVKLEQGMNFCQQGCENKQSVHIGLHCITNAKLQQRNLFLQQMRQRTYAASRQKWTETNFKGLRIP